MAGVFIRNLFQLNWRRLSGYRWLTLFIKFSVKREHVIRSPARGARCNCDNRIDVGKGIKRLGYHSLFVAPQKFYRLRPMAFVLFNIGYWTSVLGFSIFVLPINQSF